MYSLVSQNQSLWARVEKMETKIENGWKYLKSQAIPAGKENQYIRANIKTHIS